MGSRGSHSCGREREDPHEIRNGSGVCLDAFVERRRTGGLVFPERCLQHRRCVHVPSIARLRGLGNEHVRLGSGANTATLTFNGVDTTVAIGNQATLVSLGSFATSGGAGFTFPTRPNPNTPILKFDFKIRHTSPVEDTNTKTLWFGPGGKPDLPLLLGSDHTSFPLSLTSSGHNYPAFVYSLSPFPFKINGGGMTDLTARVGVVPEPATFVLVGGGLAAAIAARRRRRAGQPVL